MQYISHDGAGNLQLADQPNTHLPADHIRIDVAFAGINKPDLLQRFGLYPPPPSASPILGLEVSGTIAELGDEVTGFALGEPVCALVNGGGYATQVDVAAGQVISLTDLDISLSDAASLPEVWFTCYSNLIDLGKLNKGDRVLIHGGAGGIGSAAIQLAKLMGATVYTTVGSPQKQQFVKDLGADYSYLYGENFWPAVTQDSRGIDVILDMIGGDYVNEHLAIANTDARIVSIAFMKGPTANINLLPMMLKRLTLTGSTLRPRRTDQKRAIRDALVPMLLPALKAGTVKPVVSNIVNFCPSAIDQAHAAIKDNRHQGKWVIQVQA